MSLVPAVLPVTQNPNNPNDLVRAAPICNPDGTLIGSGGTTANPATVYTAQQAVTASAAALAAHALVNGIVLTAKSTNVGNVFVGFDNTVAVTDDGSGKGYRLVPGQSISFGVVNASAVYIIGTAGDVIYIAGS